MSNRTFRGRGWRRKGAGKGGENQPGAHPGGERVCPARGEKHPHGAGKSRA